MHWEVIADGIQSRPVYMHIKLSILCYVKTLTSIRYPASDRAGVGLCWSHFQRKEYYHSLRPLRRLHGSPSRQWSPGAGCSCLLPILLHRMGPRNLQLGARRLWHHDPTVTSTLLHHPPHPHSTHTSHSLQFYGARRLSATLIYCAKPLSFTRLSSLLFARPLHPHSADHYVHHRSISRWCTQLHTGQP